MKAVSCIVNADLALIGNAGFRHLKIMRFPMKFRPFIDRAISAALLSICAATVAGQPLGFHRGGMAVHPATSGGRLGAGPKQEHLAQWMNRHSDLPLNEQQRALASEPGFSDLPPQTQQRMRDRLTQLNNMPPEQRRRLLEHTEAMEHLTLPQRQQVRGAMQEYRALPVERRRLVARAFRELREMPQPQRQAILGSDRFRGQFSDQERGTLSSLLAVEPYIPVERPNDTPASGK